MKDYQKFFIELVNKHLHDIRLTGVEFGTFDGSFTEEMADKLCIEKLYTIDLYEPLEIEYYEQAEKRLRIRRGIARYIMASRIAFEHTLYDATVDFIYADMGRKKGEEIAYILHNYDKILAEGGIMAWANLPENIVGFDYDFFGKPGEMPFKKEKNLWYSIK